MSKAFAENQQGEVREMDVSPALSAGGGKPGQGYPAVSISSTEASPVRIYRWQESGPVLGKENALASGLNSSASSENSDHAGYSSSRFPDFSPLIKDATLPSSSTRWMNSGMAWRGEYSMLKISESHSAAAVCSLSDILETSGVHPRYSLSAKAASGILRRAAKRGKKLPDHLEAALKAVASAPPTSTTREPT